MSAPTVLACETDFPVAGVVKGGELIVVVRTVSTLISLTVTSAWTWRKISRLRLFFSHWLS